MKVNELEKLIKKLKETKMIKADDRMDITDVLFVMQEEIEQAFELLNEIPDDEDEDNSDPVIREIVSSVAEFKTSIAEIKQAIGVKKQEDSIVRDILDGLKDATIKKKYKKDEFVVVAKELKLETAKQTETKLLNAIKRVVLNEI